MPAFQEIEFELVVTEATAAMLAESSSSCRRESYMSGDAEDCLPGGAEDGADDGLPGHTSGRQEEVLEL